MLYSKQVVKKRAPSRRLRLAAYKEAINRRGTSRTSLVCWPLDRERTCFIELVPEKELRVDTPSNSKNSGMQEHPKRDKYLKSIEAQRSELRMLTGDYSPQD